MFYSVHFFQFLYAIDVLTNWALTFASAAFLTIPTVLYFKLNLAFGAIYVLNKFSYLISLKTKSNCQTKMHSLLAQIRLKPFQSPCLLKLLILFWRLSSSIIRQLHKTFTRMQFYWVLQLFDNVSFVYLWVNYSMKRLWQMHLLDWKQVKWFIECDLWVGEVPVNHSIGAPFKLWKAKNINARIIRLCIKLFISGWLYAIFHVSCI